MRVEKRLRNTNISHRFDADGSSLKKRAGSGNWLMVSITSFSISARMIVNVSRQLKKPREGGQVPPGMRVMSSILIPRMLGIVTLKKIPLVSGDRIYCDSIKCSDQSAA